MHFIMNIVRKSKMVTTNHQQMINYSQPIVKRKLTYNVNNFKKECSEHCVSIIITGTKFIN